MYGPVLGASTTSAAALALPNTGSNVLLQSVVLVALVGGMVITVVGVARILAARAARRSRG